LTNRLRSRVVWYRDAPPLARERVSALFKGETPALFEVAAEERCALDIPTAPREEAIALLHVGAEVEHALMVQYLYAGYSLNENQPDPHKRTLVKRWKSAVLQIAREEMGHLTTVENMLTLIGGPLCFEREDYPIVDADLWPFAFELEPLTKASLGKYVLAEMPSEQVLEKLGLKKEIDEIKAYVRATEKVTVNRVGLIYEKIMRLFTAGPMVQGPPVAGVTDLHPFIATADIQASSFPYQADASAWGLGQEDILIETARDRPSALSAVNAIALQGEGSDVEADLTKSHFGKFLAIYREFPGSGDWQPSRNVAINPTTNRRVSDPQRRIEGEAAVWASLANVRYRMLLMYLKHSFYIEGTSSTKSPRGSLVSWAFGEMYNIRSVSEILMSLPLRPGSDLAAGPPFEMPYTLALPARNADRWRTHRDSLTASIELVGKMLVPGQTHERYLRALRTADQTALEQITALIGA